MALPRQSISHLSHTARFGFGTFQASTSDPCQQFNPQQICFCCGPPVLLGLLPRALSLQFVFGPMLELFLQLRDPDMASSPHNLLASFHK